MRILVVGPGTLRYVVGHGDARHHAGAAFLLEPDNPGQYPYAAVASFGMGTWPVLAPDDPGPPRLRRLWDIAFGAPIRYVPGQQRIAVWLHRNSDARRTTAPDAHRRSEDEPAVARGCRAGRAAQPSARHSSPHREVDPSAAHGRMDRRELATRRRRLPSSSTRCRRQSDGDDGPAAGRRASHRSSATRRDVATASRSRPPTTRSRCRHGGSACRCRCCTNCCSRTRSSTRSITKRCAPIRSDAFARSPPRWGSTGRPRTKRCWWRRTVPVPDTS